MSLIFIEQNQTFWIIYIKYETSKSFGIYLEITRPFLLCLSSICFLLLFVCYSLHLFSFFLRYVSVSRTLKSISRSLLCQMSNIRTDVSGRYYSRGHTAAAVSDFHERPTKGLRFCVVSFNPFDVHLCYPGSAGSWLSRREFSLPTCRKPRIDTLGPNVRTPPQSQDLQELVSRVGMW